MEIRAWDKINKIWEDFTLEELLRGQARLFQLENCSQFTGLYDRNNKKIYEGDILRTGWGGLTEVKYIEKDAGYRLVAGTMSWKLSRFSLKEYKYEVIGNIYENPELLDPKLGGSDG